MRLLLIKNWVFVAIVVFGLLLRIYDLSKIPTGVHGDEASIGYNAFSLLKTLRDQDGNFLPLAIDQFGDFRPAGYHYLAIPFVALFDLNAFSTRLPAALFGSFSIIIFYLFVKELFESKTIGLISSFILAISPWHIAISRATSESVIAAFFVLTGVYFFLRFIKKPTTEYKLFLFSFTSFMMSFLFYHAARFFVPLFLLPFFTIVIFLYKKQKRIALQTGLGYAILLVALYFLFTIGQGTSRPSSISIFNIPGGTKEVQQQIDEDGKQNPILTRFYHNKLFFYSRLFLTSYAQHFDGDFLFVTNGLPVRYRIPWTGSMYPIEAPFLLLGFAILLAEAVTKRKFLYLIPLVWLLLGPIPAGLTWEDIPNVQRASFMMYGLAMITAFGIHEFLSITKRQFFLLAVLFIAILYLQNFLYFSHNYFYHSRIHEPWHRSSGEEDLVFSLAGLANEYDKVIMTTQHNNNLIHHLFFLKFDPKKFHSLGSPREKENLQFGKLVLTGNSCPLEGNPNEDANVTPGIMYVNKEDCRLPKNAQVVKIVRTSDGLPAFMILKLK